jgi:tetratricopeptide (TPR) repeat protein
MPDDTETRPSRLTREPTPEFVQRCREAVDAWERGQMPVREAMAALRNARQEAKITRFMANTGFAEHMLGYIEHLRGNLESSIQHYTQAHALFNRVANPKYAAHMSLNLAENYRYKGDYDKALEIYQDVYAIMESLDEVRLHTFASLNQGMALLDLEEFSNAHRALVRTVALMERWTEDLDQKDDVWCQIQCGLALVHLEQDNPHRAWECALVALETAQKDMQPWALGYAYRVIGILASRLETLPDPNLSANPDEHFKKALLSFRVINAEAEYARTMFMQARSLGRRGERLEAARKFQQAMLIFNRLGMINDAARAAEAQLELI